MQDEVKRKPGRPSKDKRGTFTFRVTAKLREHLEAAAESSGRSVSEEIERRIEQSFDWERQFGGFEVAPLLTLLSGAFGLFNEERPMSDTERDARFGLLTAALARALNSVAPDFYAVAITTGDANTGPGQIYKEFANQLVRNMDVERRRLNKAAEEAK